MENTTATISTIQMEIVIAAPPAKVWSALVDNIGEWWPDDFYAGGVAGQRTFQLEARPGGRMYEGWGNDDGVLWGTVVSVETNKTLQVLGHLFPNWGGPSQWYGSWSLEERKGQTLLTFSESAFGAAPSDGGEEKTDGWMLLWSALKVHVESRQ